MHPNPHTEIQNQPVARSLVVAMLTQFACGGAVIPFVILWLRDRGCDFHEISVIFSASSATLLVFPFFWGMLADRFIPLNRLFIVMNLWAALCLAFLVTQTSFWGLLAGFTLLYASLNPTMSLVNALGFHHLARPKEQFAKLRAWGSLGWILPFLPISLWTALRPHAKLDFTLHLGVACCLAMVAVSFWLPHTAPGAGRRAGEPRSQGYFPAVRRLLCDRNYVVLLIAFFLIAGSFNLVTFYSPAVLEDQGVSRPWLGPVQAIGVLVEILLFLWQPGLLRRWNYSSLILAGCVALALRQLLFVLMADAWILCASYILTGAVVVFCHVSISMLVNNLAPLSVRATAQTLLQLVGYGVGPTVVNWVSARLTATGPAGLRPVFIFGLVLSLMAAALIAQWRRHAPASLR